MNEQKNNLGIIALVLGAVSFLCCGLATGIPAIVVGRASQQAEAQGLANNGVLGKVGFIVGIVGSALWALVALIYLVPLLLTAVFAIPFIATAS